MKLKLKTVWLIGVVALMTTLPVANQVLAQPVRINNSQAASAKTGEHTMPANQRFDHRNITIGIDPMSSPEEQTAFQQAVAEWNHAGFTIDESNHSR